MLKRIFDLFFSFLAIVVLLLPALIIAIIIVVDSKGGVLYKQKRVGQREVVFSLLKFRSMYVNSDKKGLLTVGVSDNRVTKVGKFLRRAKIDELPQLINIFLGQMSFVGPRPEVPKYVALYTAEQKKIFAVKPGLTDYASLKFINENEVLALQENPEKYYIEVLMQEKLKLNLQYIDEMSFWTDVKIIIKTIFKIL
ncbi:MAG: sugar transferase [Bacteroidales bacterium]|nr:sugar transferase [Bacteroidales bacterium]